MEEEQYNIIDSILLELYKKYNNKILQIISICLQYGCCLRCSLRFSNINISKIYQYNEKVFYNKNVY